MPSALYIIGNGFDRHHGIPSSYLSFGEYLKSVDDETYRIVEQYLAFDEDFWGSFEERLAHLDYHAVIEGAEDFLASYAADDWRDSYNHDYQFEIERVVGALSETLSGRFADWARQLPIPSRSQIPCAPIALDVSAAFLTFNYTPTLELVYGVSASNILYIHGNATRPSDRLVLGHGWNPAARVSLNKHAGEDTDTRVIEGNHLIDSYFARTFKPTAEIIRKNGRYFGSLGAVKKIYIMGHSLADVDLPYFQEIVRHVDGAHATWKVSHHGDPTTVQRQFGKLEVDVSRAEFVLLKDF